MPPDLEARVRHGAGEPAGHRVGAHAVAVVNARDHHVQPLEDGVGIVQRAVGEDVRLRPPQQAHGYLLLHPRDLVPLGAEPVHAEAARIRRGGRVVGDGEVAHAARLRGPRHLLHRVAAVGVHGVAVDEPLDVVQADQVGGQTASARGLDLALVLA